MPCLDSPLEMASGKTRPRMDHVMRITSRDNDHVKYAKRVRDGREAGMMFIEGRRLVEEAARSGITAERLFVTREYLDSVVTRGLRAAAIFEIGASVFESIADTKNPQGVVAIAEIPVTGPTEIETSIKQGLPLVIYLDQINNPSNLGAVVRTAEAAGAAGVIVSRGSADIFSPKALRAAMGSTFRLPIWTGIVLDEAVEWARTKGLSSVAAAVNARQIYTAIDWKVPRMVVLGSEAHGISENDLEKIDELVVIPMENEVESLNIAVAAGVIMFEAKRQNADS